MLLYKFTNMNDIFNGRPVFYCEKYDYCSQNLMDFAKLGLPLSKQYLKLVIEYEKSPIHSLGVSSIDCHTEIVQGVSCRNKMPEMLISDTVDLETHKATLKNCLIKTLKDTDNSLLLLTGGIDSQLLLHLMMESGVNFTACFIKSSQNNELKYVTECAKKYGFKLLIYDCSQISRGMNLYNPPFTTFGTRVDQLLCDVLSQPEFHTFHTVVTGFESETILGQTKWALYNHYNDFEYYNKTYGKYLTYNFKSEERQCFLNKYGNFKNRSLEKLRQVRNYTLLEKMTGKTFISPYLNKEIFRSTLNLNDSAVIKNAYKLTQFEILQDMNVQTHKFIKQTTDIGSYARALYPGPRELHKTWSRNYQKKKGEQHYDKHAKHVVATT